MTCHHVIDFLAAYLAHELPPEEQAEFSRHIEACPPCVHYLRTYEATILLERGVLRPPEHEAPSLPPELLAAVLAARRKSGR
ncbi:MAG TPA: zf-HC2 domain-containing protein [Planctomycetota bacterium]|nr:zf-HC2 domain-containing protein [Planctomycetota bacterium]